MRTRVSRSSPRVGRRAWPRRAPPPNMPPKRSLRLPRSNSSNERHRGLRPRLLRGTPPARGAEGVVGAALLGVGEQVVGGLDLLELLLRTVVARVSVRVVFAREFAVGLLDLVVGRVLRDAEHLVGAGHGSLLRDDHPGGPDDLVAEAVAPLHDLEHRALLGIVCRLRQHCLVDVRVELALPCRSPSAPPSRATFAAIARRDGLPRPAPPPRAAPRPRACARDRRARGAALGPSRSWACATSRSWSRAARLR